MAEENEEGQEKTEEASERRLEKAREEGQVARSRELTTMAVLMGAAIALLVFGSGLGAALERLMRHSFAFDRQSAFDTDQMAIFLYQSLIEAGLGVLPIMIILLIAAIVGSVAIGGLLVSGKAITPQFSRINPFSGLKRMFSMNALVELFKAIAKVGLVLTIAILILQIRREDLLSIAQEPTKMAMIHALWTISWSFLLLSAATILIAAVDVPYQIFDHNKKLRMTKQEVKDEYKDTEGKPEVKQRIRQLQRDMANRRMMQDVPKADLVITNPDHYAVALKYDQKTMVAPVVLAKATDEVAMKIQEIAREYKIEIVRAPPLTRAVYHNTRVGDEIPAGLYVAVAQVLAYVFQLRRYRKGQSPRPGMPDMPIPEELRRDP